jgi:AcrR family transcriptional regulator
LKDRRPAQDRSLAAAKELFYEEGVNLVGIDRVIERAGVGKASLYDCFGSKEELIRSCLQQRHDAAAAARAMAAMVLDQSMEE